MTYLVRRESISEMLPALRPFFEVHASELGPLARPLDPRWGVYLEGEARGEALLVIVWDAQTQPPRILGYWVGFLGPELHYATTLSATTDIFWVRPGSRGARGLGSAALALFRGVEREIRACGAQFWYTDLPLSRGYGHFLESLGHRPVSVFYRKELG